MLEFSTAVPTVTDAFSAQLDVGGLDVAYVIGQLSGSLGPGDAFLIYGALDPSANGASPNLVPLASVSGQVGLVTDPPQVGGWRYLFVQRTGGGGAGTFYASGDASTFAPTFPASVSLPTYNQLAVLPLASFGGQVTVALGGNLTQRDVVNVYGSDDDEATDLRGLTYLGTVHGGSAADEPGSAGLSLAVRGYAFAYVQRVGGATPGSAYAWGATDGTAAPARWNVVDVTSDYAAGPSDYVRADTSGGGFSVTPSPLLGAETVVKKVSGDGNVVTVPGLSAVDGGTQTLGVPGQAITTIGDGSTADVVG